MRRGSVKVVFFFKDLGKYFEDGEIVGVYDGWYGFYVKYGKVNVFLFKDMFVEDVIWEKVLEFLYVKVSSKKFVCGRKFIKLKVKNN